MPAPERGDRNEKRKEREGWLRPTIAVFDHQQEAVLLSSIHYPGSRLKKYTYTLRTYMSVGNVYRLVRAEAEADSEKLTLAASWVVCSRFATIEQTHLNGILS